jgi:hypothetical protein
MRIKALVAWGVACWVAWGAAGGSRALAESEVKAELRGRMLLHASFDRQLDADAAAGDGVLYSGKSSSHLKDTAAGLPASGAAVWVRDGGVSGGHLHFVKKNTAAIFFKGPANIGYAAGRPWTITVSYWMKGDPNADLEPGYCDPIQLVGQGSNDGFIFCEFSKDHSPRHFRLAIRPILPLWDPEKKGWENVPRQQRPSVEIERYPFAAGKWTHVCFTLENLNTGREDGTGKLYLDGKPQGAVKARDLSINWESDKTALKLGALYVGRMDDVAVFKGALSEEQIQAIAANGAVFH